MGNVLCLYNVLSTKINDTYQNAMYFFNGIKDVYRIDDEAMDI